MLEYRKRRKIIQRDFKRLDVIKAISQFIWELVYFILVSIPVFLLVISIVYVIYAVKWVFRKLSNMV
jgi:hypothetical protein